MYEILESLFGYEQYRIALSGNFARILIIKEVPLGNAMNIKQVKGKRA